MKRLVEKFKNADAAVDLEALAAADWDTSLAEVIAYRSELLEAQGWECAYCRRTIYRDELGIRELDHVLPKSQSPSDAKKFDAAKASSNQRKDRRHTRGFRSFTYAPENLVITCKRCNSHKGSYDGLADRTNQPVNYPSTSVEFEWINPHVDDPEAFLEILPGYIYRPVKKSPKGQAVIHACGLRKIEELAARALDAIVFKHDYLTEALVGVMLGADRHFDDKQIVKQLQDDYPQALEATLLECIHVLREALKQKREHRLNEATQRVTEILEASAIPLARVPRP